MSHARTSVHNTVAGARHLHLLNGCLGNKQFVLSQRNRIVATTGWSKGWV